ncbi:hypothetical protein FS749_002190 [Ceratobasidium sp. UAMH 11750]|nr:hypothetical protein FS749_002190 [Ceratobasidium sp. UAMH 11750]
MNQQFTLPHTTFLTPDNKVAIEFLMITQELPPSIHTCRHLASYFGQIYKEYCVFHNGGVPTYNPNLSVLQRTPTAPEDIDILPPNTNRDFPLYRITPTMAGALNHAVFLVRRQLTYLEDVVPRRNPPPGLQLPSSPFALCGMQFIEEPEGLQNPHAFSQLFKDKSQLETLVAETQLWLAFMPMLCSLLSCAEALPAENVQHFNSVMFQHNHIAIQAHNWYMGLKKAPKEYAIFGV